MGDPFDVLPSNSERKLFGGPFTWIEVDLIPAAVEMGWRPVPLTDKLSHPVVDGRGMLCAWLGVGEMRRP